MVFFSLADCQNVRLCRMSPWRWGAFLCVKIHVQSLRLRLCQLLQLSHYWLLLLLERSGVTAEQLSKVFCIPHDAAVCTLSVTTQLVQYNTDSSLSRNVSTDDCALQYRKITLKFFTDTLFATKGAKSTRGNICAQIFVSDKGFRLLYPMKDQQSYFLALKEFAKDVGALEVLVCDAPPAQK